MDILRSGSPPVVQQRLVASGTPCGGVPRGTRVRPVPVAPSTGYEYDTAKRAGSSYRGMRIWNSGGARGPGKLYALCV